MTKRLCLVCGRETGLEPCEVCGKSTCQDCGPCFPEGYGCVTKENHWRPIAEADDGE